MSDTFEPGEGWREVDCEEVARQRVPLLRFDNGEGGTRYWVPEAPVPPLPSASWTVIEGRWRDSASSTCP